MSKEILAIVDNDHSRYLFSIMMPPSADNPLSPLVPVQHLHLQVKFLQDALLAPGAPATTPELQLALDRLLAVFKRCYQLENTKTNAGVDLEEKLIFADAVRYRHNEVVRLLALL